MNPNWKDAPPWAMYFATDVNLKKTWFEDKPKLNECGEWEAEFGLFEDIEEAACTLQERGLFD